MYAAIYTQSNILFAVKRLNQYFNDSTKHHERIFKHFLKYVRFIIHKNITYKNNKNLKFVEFSNFDYVVDILNRKSILTYVYMIVDESMSWMNRKQKSLTIFTTEADYMTLSTCAKKNMWLMQFLKDMKYNKYLKN